MSINEKQFLMNDANKQKRKLHMFPVPCSTKTFDSFHSDLCIIINFFISIFVFSVDRMLAFSFLLLFAVSLWLVLYGFEILPFGFRVKTHTAFIMNLWIVVVFLFAMPCSVLFLFRNFFLIIIIISFCWWLYASPNKSCTDVQVFF